MIFNSSFGGKALPILTNPGASSDLLEGKQLIDQDGNPLTGTLPTKTSSDLTASGSSIIVPAGYYSEQASKSVATATQATPSISVSTAGLITASSTQSAGYVAAGTKSATSQLTTQAGKTVTPSTSTQTAVSSGRYTTGTVYVAGDADLKAANIKSGVNIFGVTGTYAGATLTRHSVSFSSAPTISRSGGTIYVDYTVSSSVVTAINNAKIVYAYHRALLADSNADYPSAGSLSYFRFDDIEAEGGVTFREASYGLTPTTFNSVFSASGTTIQFKYTTQSSIASTIVDLDRDSVDVIYYD